MIVRSTYFHHFRNIGPQRRSWPPGFNLIVGPNGAGKTNFIEGLNLIAGWGPFERGERIAALVRWRVEPGAREERASLWAKVFGECAEYGEGGEMDWTGDGSAADFEGIEVFASVSARCALKWDGRPIGASLMRGRLPVLSFLSGHLSLLKGGASYRRQLLDRVGSLVSQSYALRLHDYRKGLRQKAVLLRRGNDAWAADRALAPLGSWLWSAREEIARMIAENLGAFSELQTAPLGLRYIRGGGGAAENPSDDFKLSLRAAVERERAARMPLVGPQRDEVELTSGGRPSSSLSRGQGRRAAAALLLASALAVERSLGRKPILIFDEISSELDESGRDAILSALLSTGNQIFATTTEELRHRDLSLFRMRDGRLEG